MRRQERGVCLFDTIYFIDTIYLTHTAAFGGQ